jgi:hypothetical protein
MFERLSDNLSTEQSIAVNKRLAREWVTITVIPIGLSFNIDYHDIFRWEKELIRIDSFFMMTHRYTKERIAWYTKEGQQSVPVNFVKEHELVRI